MVGHPNMVWFGPTQGGAYRHSHVADPDPTAQRSERTCSETEPVGCGWQTGGQEAMTPHLADLRTNLAGYLSELCDSVFLLVTVWGCGVSARCETAVGW